MDQEKEILNNRIAELKLRHDSIKEEMFKIIEASKILNEQYKNLENELYSVEDEYVDLMKKIVE